MKASVAVLAASATLLSACATIVEGTDQKIFVNVTPEAADCTAHKSGKVVGTYSHVTHDMTVSKGTRDITVACTAPGYKDKSVVMQSSASGWAIAGALILDLGIVDYSTGALNKYDSTVSIVLEPLPKI
jgi:uncharacterized protein YceK